jgi:hypothetical protein
MSIRLLDLFSTPKIADMALCPVGEEHSGQGFDGGPCVSSATQQAHNLLTLSLLLTTLWYFLATLVFELPILWLMGFKSRRAITWAVIANLITVFCFHFATVYCSNAGTCNLTRGFGLIGAEVLVTAFEAMVYILTLRRELPIGSIILASILANACSAIIGGYIVNNLLGGFH